MFDSSLKYTSFHPNFLLPIDAPALLAGVIPFENEEVPVDIILPDCISPIPLIFPSESKIKAFSGIAVPLLTLFNTENSDSLIVFDPIVKVPPNVIFEPEHLIAIFSDEPDFITIFPLILVNDPKISLLFFSKILELLDSSIISSIECIFT